MSNTASRIANEVRENIAPVRAQVFYPDVARATLNYAGYITGPKYDPIFGTLTTRIDTALRYGSFDAPAQLREMNPILSSMQKSTITATQEAARDALRHRDGWDENRINAVLPLIGEELQNSLLERGSLSAC